MYSFTQLGALGRLGNQMFQFAVTLGLGHQKNQEVYFPLENGCRLPEAFPATLEYFRPFSEIKITQRYNEIDFRYNPEVFTLPPGTDLHGYFQTEKYFHFIRDEILSLFSFNTEIEHKAQTIWNSEVLQFEAGTDTVSLHVRRGDYLLHPNFHPTCSLDYYRTAISTYNSDAKFLVFSDDPQWCKTNFQGDRFYFLDTQSDLVDLKIMTMCDHHIIANSSFSWWGAWLNTKQEKKVVAPSNWFGPELKKDPSDIYCQDWQII
jgi:hypothetical protein